MLGFLYLKSIYQQRKLTPKMSEMLWRKLIFYPKPPRFLNFNDKFFSGCFPANSRSLSQSSEPETSKPNSGASGKWGYFCKYPVFLLKMTKFMLKLLKTETYLVLFKERNPKQVEFTAKACTTSCLTHNRFMWLCCNWKFLLTILFSKKKKERRCLYMKV